jgi:hypothetical protein
LLRALENNPKFRKTLRKRSGGVGNVPSSSVPSSSVPSSPSPVIGQEKGSIVKNIMEKIESYLFPDLVLLDNLQKQLNEITDVEGCDQLNQELINKSYDIQSDIYKKGKVSDKDRETIIKFGEIMTVMQPLISDRMKMLKSQNPVIATGAEQGSSVKEDSSVIATGVEDRFNPVEQQVPTGTQTEFLMKKSQQLEHPNGRSGRARKLGSSDLQRSLADKRARAQFLARTTPELPKITQDQFVEESENTYFP